MTNSFRRWAFAAWLLLIGGFAAMHAINLRADFPNHSPWVMDYAKFTDEGWYGNAAIRAHLFGHWYLPGDFNPAVAVPVWPFLEWILFFFTGVTIEAARGLAIAFFFSNLLLSYLFLRAGGSRFAGLLAVTMAVTSPFLYCFSRLAILEPMLITLTLGAFNLAVRLPKLRRPILASVCIGFLFTLMMLTKTTAVFLLPALGWAILLPLWQRRGTAVRCALAAAGVFAASFGLWMALVVHYGLMTDYKYLFVVNKYPKPSQLYWPIVSLWWSFHGGLWIDHILVPLAGLVFLGAVVAALLAKQNKWGSKFLLDPVVGVSVLAVAGYILFMTYQNHPQPRYFAVAAFFCFFVAAKGAETLLAESGWIRTAGKATVACAAAAIAVNCIWTLNYVTHPEYTFVTAAERLTRYIDQHPNGKRLLMSISGDEITLVTHIPAICDDFGTQELSAKLGVYKPGWYATWNDFDPGSLEDIHTRYSVQQVAGFRAFDDEDRNVLVLFKLRPLPNGEIREQDERLAKELPDDEIDISVE